MNILYLTTSVRFKIMLHAYQNWIKKEDLVLDVGCGNGIVAKLIKDHFTVNMTACDINNYLIHDLPFITIGSNGLDQLKKRFDLVMLNDVLHHIPKNEQAKILQDCLKIANKILIFEAEPTFFGKVTDIILNKHHYNSLSTPLSFRRIIQWQIMFKKMNLKSSLIKPPKPFWYPFSHIAFCVQKN